MPFYSLQTPARYRRWRDDTPQGFVFSVKAPRYIRRITRWSRGGEPADARRVDGRAPRAAHRDVYCYFDNDVKVCAPRDARTLMHRLRVPLAPVAPAQR